jgi:hypothetical protein
MSADFTTKRGDTRTALEATLKRNGVVVDLTDCIVRFRMRAKNASTNKVDKIATVAADATTGVVLVPWETTDIDTADIYDGEFEVTFPSGKPESFPNDGYVTIEILADFG